MIILKKLFGFCLLFLLMLTTGSIKAQFQDNFTGTDIEGWFFFTGDGKTTMDFIQKEDYARIKVDATRDRHNVWWAIIKRNVAGYLDLEKLKDPDYELRVEARVKVSHAPRRLNFMVNTQRTTNFHKQLREFDIPDTTGWHVISMTTSDLDAVPGDSLYVQLGVTDWGRGTYHVAVDYYRAEIINVYEAGPDQGEPLTYHPPVPNLSTFSFHSDADHDAVIHTGFPEVNFSNWSEAELGLLSVSTNQWAILRWDFSDMEKGEAEGPGILELTTHSVTKGGNYSEAYGEDLGMEFGKIRIIEILGGDPYWEQDKVTYNSLAGGMAYEEVFNTQMIFDAKPAGDTRGKTYITISRPVMQRLLDGTTKGILIRPLGAIHASFYATRNQPGINGPRLHFNLNN